jgi:hypothetical protein
MSKNHPTDNIYSILEKLDALKPTAPTEERFALVKEIRESVEAQGSILTGVDAVQAKLQKQFSESQVNEKYDPVKAVKQCAKDHMEMNGIASVDQLEAEDIESIGGDCQMNYQDVCEILGIQLPDSLGPVNSYGPDEHGNIVDFEESSCNECGMYESECGCDHTNEAVHIGKYGTEYYGTKDFTGDDEDTPKAEPKVKKGRGRPTKASTGEITSQARMPWGGKPPKDTYKHQKGSFVHKISEGLNFRNIDEETRRSLDELLEELQKDVAQYKATGHCSETLKDFLTVHRHGKAQKLAQEATKVPTLAPAVPSIPGGIGQHNPGQAVKDLRNPFKRTYEETDPLEEELAKLAELAGITQVADEGAGVMHFKKQQAEKAGKDSFTLGDKEFPVDESKVDISEPADKPVNAPSEEYFGMKSGLGPMNPGEADSGEKSMFGGKGDNPMTQQPNRPAKPVRSVKEAFAKMEARLAKEYESIKKISK